MKPDWKYAPCWANHLTWDKCYGWVWWECKPYKVGEYWDVDRGEFKRSPKVKRHEMFIEERPK